MSIKQSANINVGYPILATKFIDNKTILVAGGGGEGKHGVPNNITAIRCGFKVSDHGRILQKFREIKLPANEDSPQCLDTCRMDEEAQFNILIGCNQSYELLSQMNINNNVRKYIYTKDEHLRFVDAAQFEEEINADAGDYPKVMRVSNDNSIACLLTSTVPSQLYIFNPDSLDLKYKYKPERQVEIKDVALSPGTGKTICFISSSSSIDTVSSDNGTLISTTTQIPKVAKQLQQYILSKLKFINEDEVIITASVRGGKGATLLKYNIKTNRLIKAKIISKKFNNIVGLDISLARDLIAVVGNDLSLTLIKLSTFNVLTTMKNLHEFAITSVAFSPNGTKLATGSAANTLHVLKIPRDYGSSGSVFGAIGTLIHYFFTIVLIAALGVVIQNAHENGKLDGLVGYSQQMGLEYGKLGFEYGKTGFGIAEEYAKRYGNQGYQFIKEKFQGENIDGDDQTKEYFTMDEWNEDSTFTASTLKDRVTEVTRNIDADTKKSGFKSETLFKDKDNYVKQSIIEDNIPEAVTPPASIETSTKSPVSSIHKRKSTIPAPKKVVVENKSQTKSDATSSKSVQTSVTIPAPKSVEIEKKSQIKPDTVSSKSVQTSPTIQSSSSVQVPSESPQVPHFEEQQEIPGHNDTVIDSESSFVDPNTIVEEGNQADSVPRGDDEEEEEHEIEFVEVVEEVEEEDEEEPEKPISVESSVEATTQVNQTTSITVEKDHEDTEVIEEFIEEVVEDVGKESPLDNSEEIQESNSSNIPTESNVKAEKEDKVETSEVAPSISASKLEEPVVEESSTVSPVVEVSQEQQSPVGTEKEIQSSSVESSVVIESTVAPSSAVAIPDTVSTSSIEPSHVSHEDAEIPDEPSVEEKLDAKVSEEASVPDKGSVANAEPLREPEVKPIGTPVVADKEHVQSSSLETEETIQASSFETEETVQASSLKTEETVQASSSSTSESDAETSIETILHVSPGLSKEVAEKLVEELSIEQASKLVETSIVEPSTETLLHVRQGLSKEIADKLGEKSSVEESSKSAETSTVEPASESVLHVSSGLSKEATEKLEEISSIEESSESVETSTVVSSTESILHVSPGLSQEAAEKLEEKSSVDQSSKSVESSPASQVQENTTSESTSVSSRSRKGRVVTRTRTVKKPKSKPPIEKVPIEKDEL
ncbi:SED4 [[Candida] subhashii]|uniref:Guanine nucleotide-exchange factor SEC12 n=1 Tax=[Candida] subhashii TaxID=561895 RepID=A0A8J5QC50_9ASCO|nr:SED4 [[Candida] subhashii]KAG7660822.1 SED4 [[Candida] subhashii]